MKITNCDIIISGAGMAGLSLLYRAMKDQIWLEKSIIVFDSNPKNINDKTWSFWQKEPGPFDELAYRSWNEMTVFSNSGEEIKLNCYPYSYNSIRSIDFYNLTMEYLKNFKNIRFQNEIVESIISKDQSCTVVTRENHYNAKFLFNSIYKKPVLRKGDQYFLQHFKGLKIRIGVEFNPSKIYLMDFRTSQENGTSFIYTLPLKANELFVEYTVFSKTLLEDAEYNKKLEEYIVETLGCSNFEVIEEEFGVIPMTDYDFKRREGNVLNLGSIGGDTRPSTGYTFVNTQKIISQILKSFKENDHPFNFKESTGWKEKLYDSTLLNVLAKNDYKGHQIFTDLFKNTDAKTVFSFLDAESKFVDDLRIMVSLKPMPFVKSFLPSVMRRIFK
jgi:lycopene beta-cyclase